METQAETETIPYNLAEDDIFVLVLRPAQYEENNILETNICGRSVINWVKVAVGGWHHRFVTTGIDDDVLTVFRNNATDAKWTAVIYADMPLLEKRSIETALEYAAAKGVNALTLPRGYVFNTEFVKTNDDFVLTEFTPVNPADYTVAFNNAQISKIRGDMQRRINFNHIQSGVQILSIKDTYIDCTAEIGKNTVIEPNTYLYGETKIGRDVKIISGSRIENSTVGDGTTVNNSEIFDSTIGAKANIGPNAHIRPKCTIADGVQIGNFVEIKKSVIGRNSKVKHLSYIGDGTVGENCNIGCGVVFCNFDGKEKHTVTVGDGAFIGSNSSLVAPLVIGKNAFVGAGSVITDDVPANALAISRARQAVKPAWREDS
jgi:bifunctional N-acetylglucosamine-1-phosphate-uridyltransferase/glucosamine-1-phosphate-acetyltransferase GlmU-like protein